MGRKLLNLLGKTTAGILLVLFVLNSQHIKDGYYRYVIGEQVVKIIGERGTGSGFHVKSPSGKTYIMTNAHVCEVADSQGILYVQNQEKTVPRRVLSVYNRHDLCLIEALPGYEKQGLDIGSDLDIGEDVILIGHPSGRPLTLSKGEFIFNRVIYLAQTSIKTEEACEKKLGRWVSFFGLINFCVVPSRANGITNPSYPGNSGSPVVNKWGNVIGVLFAGSTQQLNDNYMVPLHEVKNFLKDY